MDEAAKIKTKENRRTACFRTNPLERISYAEYLLLSYGWDLRLRLYPTRSSFSNDDQTS